MNGSPRARPVPRDAYSIYPIAARIRPPLVHRAVIAEAVTFRERCLLRMTEWTSGRQTTIGISTTGCANRYSDHLMIEEAPATLP